MKQIYKLIELIKSDKKQEINDFINKENQSLKVKSIQKEIEDKEVLKIESILSKSKNINFLICYYRSKAIQFAHNLITKEDAIEILNSIN